MTSERKETQIDLEWNVLEASNGISVDFGEKTLRNIDMFAYV